MNKTVVKDFIYWPNPSKIERNYFLSRKNKN